MPDTTSLRDEARRAEAACTRFEADLSAFVDGERTELDHAEIARHIETCGGCRAFVHSLTELGRIHLFGAVTDVDLPAGAELWADLTRRLLSENQSKLAGLLYELGKSLVATGFRTSSHPDVRGLRLYAKQPGSVRQLSREGKSLFRERGQLERQVETRRAAPTGRSGNGVRSQLFATATIEGAEAFDAGRACLEQCLKLDADRHEARIYLAKYFMIRGRYDRAGQLLRTVLHARASAGERIKFFALQQLSRLYSMTHQFERAIELEREVLARAARDGNDLYQAAALTNLVIYCVKLGRLDEAEAALQRLTTELPQHVSTVTAPAFSRARDFKQALLRHRTFLAGLRGRYPHLFVS